MGDEVKTAVEIVANDKAADGPVVRKAELAGVVPSAPETAGDGKSPLLVEADRTFDAELVALGVTFNQQDPELGD